MPCRDNFNAVTLIPLPVTMIACELSLRHGKFLSLLFYVAPFYALYLDVRNCYQMSILPKVIVVTFSFSACHMDSVTFTPSSCAITMIVTKKVLWTAVQTVTWTVTVSAVTMTICILSQRLSIWHHNECRLSKMLSQLIQDQRRWSMLHGPDTLYNII